MSNPSDLKYTKDHEWIRPLANGEATIGITEYAQNSLGDITFVETPDVGDELAAGAAFGVVESVKAASDLFMPVGGEVIAVNDRLADAPELVNRDPYGDGWIIKVRLTSAEEVDGLLDAAAYDELTQD